MNCSFSSIKLNLWSQINLYIYIYIYVCVCVICKLPKYSALKCSIWAITFEIYIYIYFLHIPKVLYWIEIWWLWTGASCTYYFWGGGGGGGGGGGSTHQSANVLLNFFFRLLKIFPVIKLSKFILHIYISCYDVRLSVPSLYRNITLEKHFKVMIS